MNRTKNTYVIIASSLAATLLLPAACKVEVPAVPETNAVTLSDLKLSFETKDGSGGAGSYKDTTFRVCLFNTSTYYYTGLYGTYCLPNPAKDSRWLTPCKVNDATGAYDDSVKGTDPEATIHGLQARDGTYFMSISSPAVAMKSPRKDIYGFYYKRERTPGEKVLCISDSIRAVISGLSTNGSWLYVVNDSIRLKERRSRLKLSVSCGRDIESAVIKSVKLVNVLDSGYYLPSKMEFDYESSYLKDVTVKDYSPYITLYKEDEGPGHRKADTCDVQPFVLSMDYSKLDRNKKPVHPLPEIDVVLGEEGDKTAKIPLAFNFLPEFIYECNVVVNSSYVTLHLSVLNWDNGGAVTGSNESYSKQPITVTVSLWDSGTQGADGDTEIHDEEW